VNYQLGRVQILDPALQASNTPINVSLENNSIGATTVYGCECGT
jgi:cell surface protein SprA